ncbi:MAG: OmpA family protein [Saprospiraceae bacterium]|nr:OmpA family protein [Saprospiraceae bacterium]
MIFRVISLVFGLFLNCTFLFAQAERYSLEVGAYAEPVGLEYFNALEGVYETVDANLIYRYYIDVRSKAEGERERKKAINAGFVYAKVVDFNYLREQCSASCAYIPPNRTGAEIESKNRSLNPLPKNVDVKEIESIFFDFDKASLRSKSKNELDKLASILVEYPAYYTELRAHTDAKGTLDYNQRLSERRANAAKRYLESRDIASDRIITKTYGENAPIAKNQLADGADTETGRQFNRRVELVILNEKGRILSFVERIYVPEDLKN